MPETGPPPKRSATHLDVINMPPPWRRSLTESGMSRVTTRLDVAAVVLFVLGVLAFVAWLASAG
jgi:hypothetical protein